MLEDERMQGLFSINEVIKLMLGIAEAMGILHHNHDILHKDLEASIGNVLVGGWGLWNLQKMGVLLLLL